MVHGPLLNLDQTVVIGSAAETSKGDTREIRVARAVGAGIEVCKI